MEHIRIQAVAIGLLLRLQHHLAQPVRREEVILTVGKDGGFKAVPGINVTNDLGRVRQLAFYEGKLLFLVRSSGNGGIHDHTLIEGGGCLRHRHGVVPVQNSLVAQDVVVEGMAQLMSQGDDVAEGAVKIGENTALIQFFNAGAEGAAGFAGTGKKSIQALAKASATISRAPYQTDRRG